MLIRKNQRQTGFTLVELLVSMTLGVLIVVATVALYSVSSSSSNTSSEEQGIQDNGRFALMMLGSSARLAGLVNYQVNTPLTDPGYLAVQGTSNARIPAGSYDLTTIGATNNRASSDVGGDTVAFRFQGSTTADGSTVGCLGDAIAPTSKTDIAMNALFVTADTDGEPALKCVFVDGSGVKGNRMQPLARGIETLRAVYGVDTNNDSIPDKWLTATEVSATVAVAPSTSPWGMVTAVRIGMVVRGAPGSATQGTVETLYPLGSDFSSAVTFTTPSDGRLRRVFNATFQLRNPPNWGTT